MKRKQLTALLIIAAMVWGAQPVLAASLELDSLNWTVVLEDTSQVRVSFDANGGQGTAPEPIIVQSGQSITLPDADLGIGMYSAKLSLIGWADTLTASVPAYYPGDELMVTGDRTLYAVYGEEQEQEEKDTYRVTYRISGVETSEEVAAGEEPAKVPALSGGYLGWRDSSGRITDPDQTAIWADQTFTAYQVPALSLENHDKFMDGSTDGKFHPDQSMTRAEAAQVLYVLLAEKPENAVSFTDVSSSDWYAKSVGALGALGLVTEYADGSFHPNTAITRGDFAVMLTCFLPEDQSISSFTDVSSADASYEAIGKAASYGLFSGYPDGSFHPNGTLTRAEAAVVYNKLLGRTADTAAISASQDVRLFPDVPTSHWAYYPIMEATVSHGHSGSAGSEVWTSITRERSTLADGFYRIDGWLYQVQDGMFLRSTTQGYFTFDADGRYTTGSATLDARLHAIVDQYTNDSMTRDQKLRALYNYVRDNFSYLSRAHIARGSSGGWEASYAEAFLNRGKGDCYSFSATYCLLARQLGLPAYTVSGGLGRNNSDHGWVEIPLDGQTYMFDTQLEWRYLHDYGRSGYNLFKMLPSKTPFTYYR